MPTWNDVLAEIKNERQQAADAARQAVDTVRRRYLLALQQHTGRNVIAYYSGWLSKPGIPESEINDEDKNGFMMAVHGLDAGLGLDLILHTPGGNIAATESIVDYLRQKFGKNVRAIVPQIAMSAGTMTACACSTILMTRHSNLGPIDPHLGGMPAYGVIEEFERAFKEIKLDASKAFVWQPIIGRYGPTFLAQCENAIKWSNAFVERELTSVMFDGDTGGPQKAHAIVERLTDFSGNKSHSRHIHFSECQEMGLKVGLIETDQKLQDFVLTVHHCFMHTLMNTNAFKIIENHNGVAFVKQRIVQQLVQPAVV
ncbi:MAG: S49 family peptidase [Vicinamibacterales bacterium]